MIFSEWLQQQLKSRRLTGAELAERVDISRASIYFDIIAEERKEFPRT